MLNGLAINEAVDTGGGVMCGDCWRIRFCRSRSAAAAAAADNADDDEWWDKCKGLPRVKLEDGGCDGEPVRCDDGGREENCTLGLVLLNAELVIGVVGFDDEGGAEVGVRLPSGNPLTELIGGPPISGNDALDTDGGINGGPK